MRTTEAEVLERAGLLEGLGRLGSQKQGLFSGLLRYTHWNYEESNISSLPFPLAPDFLEKPVYVIGLMVG